MGCYRPGVANTHTHGQSSKDNSNADDYRGEENRDGRILQPPVTIRRIDSIGLTSGLSRCAVL